MSEQGFDARYPAMFQPGGEQSTTPEPPAAAPTPVPLPAQMEKPAPPIVPARVATPSEKNLWLIWRMPLALAVALIAAAVFCFMAQYWLKVSISFDESAAFGWINQQWPNLIFPASSPLLAAGLSLLVVWLWMVSRATATLEARYRAVFRNAAVALLLFGLFARFCQQLFPAPLNPVLVIDAETGMPVRYLLSQPWTVALNEIASVPLVVGLLMLAALLAAPSLWPVDEPELEVDGLMVRPNFYAARANLMGTGCLVVAFLVQLTPVAFPAAQPRKLVQDGDISYLQPWTETVQLLMQPFLIAAVVILVVTALRPVFRSAVAHQSEIVS
ncbi:hypothetical protein [Arthrobacter psychrolactophilus]